MRFILVTSGCIEWNSVYTPEHRLQVDALTVWSATSERLRDVLKG